MKTKVSSDGYIESSYSSAEAVIDARNAIFMRIFLAVFDYIHLHGAEGSLNDAKVGAFSMLNGIWWVKALFGLKLNQPWRPLCAHTQWELIRKSHHDIILASTPTFVAYQFWIFIFDFIWIRFSHISRFDMLLRNWKSREKKWYKQEVLSAPFEMRKHQLRAKHVIKSHDDGERRRRRWDDEKKYLNKK